jgi:5-methylcytosine-specific restriction endonuclease McrA
MDPYYLSKAKTSFQTKLTLFIYEHIISEKKAFDMVSFNRFEITHTIVREYTTVYWQSNYTDKIRGHEIRSIAQGIDAIRSEYAAEIVQFESHYTQQVFPDLFPIETFQQLTRATKCHYCGVTPDEIVAMADLGLLNKKKDRGWKLEIDRLDSNFEYRPDNTVMCCYWCNNAKTDEFTSNEFIQIAKEIRKVWDNRLRATRFTDGGEGIKILNKDDN